MEQSSHPILHLAFANSSRKKKGSNELKALQQELTALSESSDKAHKITVLREGHDAVPNGYELLVENYPYPDIDIIYLSCEPVELDKLYLNTNGGKRKTLDWDTLSLEQLPKLKLVFLDGGGSLDLVERFLFAGASLVVASQYTSDSSQKDQGKLFRQLIMRSLISGISLEAAVKTIQKEIESADTIQIPSDPYEYWDFKEEYEKKGNFPWGIYLHTESASLLSQVLFPLDEEIAAIVDPDESEEEEQVEIPREEEPTQAPIIAEPLAVASPVQEPQKMRLRSKTFREVSPTRHLQDIRSHESEGILRKVAYWSQAFSPNSLSPQKQVPVSLLKPPPIEEKQVPEPEPEEKKEKLVGKVISFPPIQEEVETAPINNTLAPSPTQAPPIQHTNSGQGSFHKLLAMVGMGALLLTVGSSLLYNYISDDTPSSALALSSAFSDTDTYNVLLLPFLPDMDCKTTQSLHEAAVRDHLSTFPESQELGIQVATSDGHVIGCPSSAEEAKRIGEVNNAHLVIWGKPGEGQADEQGLLKVQYVALNQHQDPLTKPNSQIGYQAFGDVYDLQEGIFAGRSKDMVYWILAVAHLKSDDYPAAINYIQQITIEDRPEFSLLMQMLAKCYQGMDRFEDAIDAYDRAIFLDPHNPNIYHHRGRLHQQLNHKDLALADYTEAIRLNPKHLKAQYQRNLLLEDVQSSSRRQALSLPLSSR